MASGPRINSHMTRPPPPPRLDLTQHCAAAGGARQRPPQSCRRVVKYCRAPDGVRLAYAISGSGPLLVKSGNWMNHLEYDWESPIWRHVFRGLSREHTLIRYDARGNGMSDWDVDSLSLDAWVTDLETVVTLLLYARRRQVLTRTQALWRRRKEQERPMSISARNALIRSGFGSNNAA